MSLELGKITTYTGRTIDVRNPDPEQIYIHDIAVGLANQCRFAGHVTKWISVARHSLNVCELVQDPNLKLAALLHDASEAYLLDMPSPIKALLPHYKALEENMMRVIAKKYGFEYPLHPLVKMADRNALEAEELNFRGGSLGRKVNFDDKAVWDFIHKYVELTGR